MTSIKRKGERKMMRCNAMQWISWRRKQQTDRQTNTTNRHKKERTQDKNERRVAKLFYLDKTLIVFCLSLSLSLSLVLMSRDYWAYPCPST